MERRMVAAPAFIALMAAVAIGGEFASFVVALGIVYGIAVLGLHLLLNEGGQVSLAHGAFVAVGAFVGAHVLSSLGGHAWPLAVVLATLCAAAAGAVVSLPLMRMHGFAVAIITLVFAFAFDRFLLSQTWFAGTSGGIAVAHPSVGPLTLDSSRTQLLLVGFAGAAIYALTLAVRRSRFGRALVAVRSNENMARSVGIDVRLVKLGGYTVAGAYAGLAGALWTMLLGGASRGSFPAFLSLSFLAVTIIGGRGSPAGPAISGLMFSVGVGFFGGFGKILQYLSPAVLILVLIQFPGGLNEQGRHVAHLARRLLKMPSPQPRRRPALVSVTARPEEPAVRDARPAIAARSVTVRFGGVTAVSDASLEVRPGEIVGLIGPNGAGKTTLVNVITGMLRPDAGSVEIAGSLADSLSAHERARTGVRRTFQSGGLVQDESVLTNLLIASHTTAAHAVVDRCIALLDEVGVPLERTDELVRNLPVAMSRLVEIASALAGEPTVLLLDEPTVGLGADEGARVADVVRLRASQGVAGLVVAHDMRFVMGLVDRVLVLSDGRLIAEGTPADVRANRAVREIYLGRERTGWTLSSR